MVFPRKKSHYNFIKLSSTKESGSRHDLHQTRRKRPCGGPGASCSRATILGMPKERPLPPDSTPAGRLTEARLHQVLGYQLAQASIATTRVFMDQVGKPFDLRPVEYTLLTLISENPGGTASHLAKALAVTAPNITVWVDRLEKRGFVQRLPNTADKRSQRLQATASGAQLAAQMTQHLLEGERQGFDNLSDAERLLLIELLHKVACRRGGSKA